MISLRSARAWIERRFSGAASTAVGSLPAPVLSGVKVTPETALTFTAYFACINVRATDLASLPLEVKRRLRSGGKVALPADPRYDLVYCEPNRNVGSIRFRQAMHGHRLGWGNGYSEIKRSGGMPRELLLHSPRPNDTWPEVAKNGNLWYQVEGGRRQVRAEDMIHTAGLGFNGLTGYSPVALHAQAVGYGLAVEQFGASFYGNAATPRGAIKIQKSLTDEMKRNLRESFGEVHSGTPNGNRLAIFEEGMEFQPFSVNPNDAEYIATRQFQAVEMCRIFRVPPPRIQDYTGVTGVYKAFADLIQDYISGTLGPDAEAFEQELNRKLFTRSERSAGLHVAHDFAALMRGNASERMAYNEKRLATGSITPDQIAESEGDNPTGTPEGKRFYISSSLIPIDKAGQPKAPASQPPPAGRSEERYNKYHGKDGKFTSAHGGGKHGKIVPDKKKPESLDDQLSGLANMRRDPSSHVDHPVGHVGEIDTKLINFDPQRFQYKLGGQGDHGVTDALHGVKKFDPNLSGILQVWKDPADSKAYVVNGHHRLDLANKLGADKVAVRFIGAKDAKEARGIGALTNIAEGRGTSVDAAHFFRDTGHDRAGLEAKGIPLKERIATEGLALANLHKPIFDRVTNGEMSAARGAIIGDGLSHAQQASVVKTLDKFGKSKAPSDATLRQTVAHAKHAPTVSVKSHDLFGDNEEDVSLAFHRGETSAHVMERLSREKRVFGTVAKEKNASDLEKGGNKIDAAASGKISHEAARNLDTFNLLQHRSGPVSKLLNEAAERIHKGEKKRAVHDDVYRRLPDAVQSALSGG